MRNSKPELISVSQVKLTLLVVWIYFSLQSKEKSVLFFFLEPDYFVKYVQFTASSVKICWMTHQKSDLNWSEHSHYVTINWFLTR